MPTITGTSGDDTLTGTDQADVISGLAGADAIQGGAGGDVLTGGDGRDTFVYASGADSLAGGAIDIITDFVNADDVIDLRALGAINVDIAYVTPPGRSGSQAAYISADTPQGRFQIYVDSLSSVLLGDNVLTGGTRRFIGNATGSSLAGVSGSSFNDVIYAAPTGGFISGGGGADVLFCGAGQDTFIYGVVAHSTRSNYDLIANFQTGLDVINISSSLAVSTISIVRNDAGGSFVFIETAQGAMTIAALGAINGADVTGLGIAFRGQNLFGSSAGDAVSGTTNDDVIFGGGGADTLSGSGGFDHLYGEAGDDILIGGGGADALTGGTGADIFRYVQAQNSTAAAPDIITDFVSTVDKIDLTAVRLGAADRFAIVQSGTGSLLWVDLGGDGVTDMLIQLANVQLTATDILWG